MWDNQLQSFLKYDLGYSRLLLSVFYGQFKFSPAENAVLGDRTHYTFSLAQNLF